MRQRPVVSLLRDVERHDEGGFVALSTEPWLSIVGPPFTQWAGRLVAITYRAGLWDEPTRPLLRFETTDGRAIDRIAPGPVAGAGLWIGRMPVGTVRLGISPTTRIGRFSFVVESIRLRAPLGLLVLGMRENPRSMRSAILTRLIGWRPESDVNLAWAIGSTHFGSYETWSKRRQRAIDLRDLDKPRFDWGDAAPITVCIDVSSGAYGLSATLESLHAQVFSGWRALILGAAVPPAPGDTRIVLVTAGEAPRVGEGLVVALAPGDRLKPHALACLVEAARRFPDRTVFYGDEDTEGADGRIQPWFKPGWSPRLQRQRPFLGRAVAVRAPLQGWSDAEIVAFVADAAIPDHGLSEPMSIRRVLLTTASPSAGAFRALPAAPTPRATVAIIIPTKDQPGLLRRALASIRRFSDMTRTRVVIIDNGSVEDETLRLFDDLRSEPAFLVIAHPGPFNYSAMCNEGASASAAPTLVFLNDDTEALQAGWLDRLAAWAACPDVGAVGAKLTYPDGRLQHVGVLLGMGESAGHFGALAAPDDPGWAGRNAAVHEVSAVTGACLAVSRAKFQAVGGFDAVDLPVELSDIDLCLKLAERGWVCLLDPAVHLIHAESASRGTATFRRLDVYEAQRAIFVARWRSQVRDDRYFHPGLSLYRRDAALG